MNSSRPHIDIEGRCSCGGVQVRYSGRPLTMILCSCRDCQKASGAGHSALALVRASELAVEGAVTSYTVTANSGHPTARHFCPVCGNPVYGAPAQYPDLRLLPVGLFDNREWFSPRSAIFYRSHDAWDILPDIPAHETYRNRAEGS